MISKSFVIYEVVSYSSEYLIAKIRTNNIHVMSLEKIDEYIYHLKIDFRYDKKFRNVFKDAKRISTHGLFYILKNRVIQKITVISIIIGILFFSYLNTLTYQIFINGNNNRITSLIEYKLHSNNIKPFTKIPSIEKLESIKKELIFEIKEIENIDCAIKGTTITLTYYLKEKENIHSPQIGKYYAKKDGVISYIDIEKGNFLFETNDYVREGELLIDDYLYLNEKAVYVGASGKVYAYTWSILELKIKTNGLEESEAYSNLLSQARYRISYGFKEKEKIDKEQILSFYYSDSEASIKIHYTLFENIAVLISN